MVFFGSEDKWQSGSGTGQDAYEEEVVRLQKCVQDAQDAATDFSYWLSDMAKQGWSCLDWNQPSIDFYLSCGAIPMQDWTTYRLTGNTLRTFGAE